ncbi:MAG: hypothetical protein ACRECO_14825, partial [Xanthobacteraceae bacterium]
HATRLAAMIRLWRPNGFDRMAGVRGMRAFLVGTACALLAAGFAAAQEAIPIVPQSPETAPSAAPAAPATPAEPAPAAPVPDPNYQPGFLDALGRWFGASKTAIDSQVKNTQDTLSSIGGQAKDVAGVAGQAAGTIVGLSGTRVVTGRQVCVVASNGAPDCAPAVDALCSAQGMRVGQSLEINTSQKCPVRVWLSGRTPKAGECRTETFVTRAVCR